MNGVTIPLDGLPPGTHHFSSRIEADGTTAVYIDGERVWR